VQALVTGKESTFFRERRLDERGEIPVVGCDSGAWGVTQEVPNSSGATEEQGTT